MKKSAIIFLVFIHNALSGQISGLDMDVVSTVGAPFDAMSSIYGVPSGWKASHVNNGDIYSVQVYKGELSFMKYDGSTLSEVYRNSYAIEDRFDLEGKEQLGDRHYIFYSRWDRPNQSEQLYVRELDFEKGDFAGPERKLYGSEGKLEDVTSSAKVSVTLFRGRPTDAPMPQVSIDARFKPKFRRTPAKDGDALLVSYIRYIGKKADKTELAEIGMHVYDQNMTEQWHRIVEFPYVRSEFAIKNYLVDSEYNAYVLAALYGEASKNSVTKRGTVLKLFRVDGKTGALSETDVSVEGLYASFTGFIENDNGDLMIFGLGGQSGYRLVSNAFANTFTKAGEEITVNKVVVEPSVVAAYGSKKLRKDIENSDEATVWGFKDIVLRSAAIGDDGSLTLFAETVLLDTKMSGFGRAGAAMGHTRSMGMPGNSPFGRGRLKPKSKIEYGNIIVAHVSPESTKSGFVKVPRSQVLWTTGAMDRETFVQHSPGEAGFVLLNKGEKPYFLFIDNKKNEVLTEDETPYTHGLRAGGYLTGYSLDIPAKRKLHHFHFDLYEDTGEKLKNFRVSNVIQCSENEILIEMSTLARDRNVWVKLKLPGMAGN